MTQSTTLSAKFEAEGYQAMTQEQRILSQERQVAMQPTCYDCTTDEYHSLFNPRLLEERITERLKADLPHLSAEEQDEHIANMRATILVNASAQLAHARANARGDADDPLTQNARDGVRYWSTVIDEPMRRAQPGSTDGYASFHDPDNLPYVVRSIPFAEDSIQLKAKLNELPTAAYTSSEEIRDALDSITRKTAVLYAAVRLQTNLNPRYDEIANTDLDAIVAVAQAIPCKRYLEQERQSAENLERHYRKVVTPFLGQILARGGDLSTVCEVEAYQNYLDGIGIIPFGGSGVIERETGSTRFSNHGQEVKGFTRATKRQSLFAAWHQFLVAGKQWSLKYAAENVNSCISLAQKYGGVALERSNLLSHIQGHTITAELTAVENATAQIDAGYKQAIVQKSGQVTSATVTESIPKMTALFDEYKAFREWHREFTMWRESTERDIDKLARTPDLPSPSLLSH